jgi:hypothetical protein
MADKDLFREALGNFAFDVASGGAIEHLAALGYTPQEIKERLDFPTPYAKVQEAYWNYCLKNRIIIESEEDIAKKRENVKYVTEYDSYGRKSFRKVVEQEKEVGVFSYVSCDFGVRSRRNAAEYEQFLSPLEDPLRSYIEGIPWPRRVVWHVLDERMNKIYEVLRDKSGYEGRII